MFGAHPCHVMCMLGGECSMVVGQGVCWEYTMGMVCVLGGECSVGVAVVCTM